ncbi:UDP-glucose 4-epimerase [Hamadaea flava]|uniref:NAD-dependent epimerase/dehydratase family protein n=1 Tax=Hamadaea flava TaxID=1742688 RepID=A0ABV8LGI4_9ACTN|nr:NAD-dependent epimerase/dehydratase family protein [Hamadaea flava]MCP2326460.1 UDP-glucose 4-epimerase [Hamadaea flava]
MATRPTRPEVVLVTGVSRFLGARIAATLATRTGVGRVIGLDSFAPQGEVEHLLADSSVEVVQADLRASGEVIADQGVEAVVHLAVISSPDQARGGRAAMKEQNVIGTMQLLAACQQAESLRRLVVRSSTAAYGASFRDPAVFTEDTEPREVPRGGYARDILDIESYVRGFRRRRPDVTATVLRFAPFIGATAETALLRYLARPTVPTVLGRDPRMQFVHVDDALEIIERSVLESHPGTFNVAGPGVITLSQAIRRAGRIALPIVEQALAVSAATGRGLISNDQIDLFVHGRVVDTTRLVREFGFTPRSTPDAFADFVRTHRAGALVTPERLAAAEESFLDMIQRVRQEVR